VLTLPSKANREEWVNCHDLSLIRGRISPIDKLRLNGSLFLQFVLKLIFKFKLVSTLARIDLAIIIILTREINQLERWAGSRLVSFGGVETHAGRGLGFGGF
jgi:hypothetical protein